MCERIGELCGPPEPPARLHGDLWSGNVMADRDGRPWLIDPSAYGGHREVDLAMLRLFGAPSERVFSAYEELAPLAGGWQERVELYQLLPLLVHALLFGGSYRAGAERAARATPALAGSGRRGGGASRRSVPASEKGVCTRAPSPSAGGCICSHAWSSPATTAAG